MRITAGVSLLLLACAPVSRVQQVGVPRAAREPQCELKIASMDDVSPGGQYAGYEMIGTVTVAAAPGAQATDPDVKNEVRPNACGLGGEVIVLHTSALQQNRSGMVQDQILNFVVYATKTDAAPSTY